MTPQEKANRLYEAAYPLGEARAVALCFAHDRSAVVVAFDTPQGAFSVALDSKQLCALLDGIPPAIAGITQ